MINESVIKTIYRLVFSKYFITANIPTQHFNVILMLSRYDCDPLLRLVVLVMMVIKIKFLRKIDTQASKNTD